MPDVALADLDADGRQDLVVAMVDGAAGQNRGLFRIGRGLSADGTVMGPWTPWTDIPDWFSWENQGVSVAVTPPDPQGARDLLVFMIDNGPQQNRGLFRIGHGLGVDGAVTGGWTPWQDVPDWFSWENAACGVAVADLDRDGGRDLIVFHVDDAVDQNQAFYRIARDLDQDGLPGDGWGEWRGVPNWFSWQNQGGGIAVTGPDAQGRRDLIVFMIDDGPEQNRGLYRIGHGLTADGTVTAWTPWIEVPGWFSWFNQGGGVAIADLDRDGSRDIVVMQIDDAIPTAESGGKNEGFFRIGRHLQPDGAGEDWAYSAPGR